MMLRASTLAVTLLAAACSGFGAAATAPSQPPGELHSPSPQDARSVPHVDRWGIYRLNMETEAIDLLYSSPTMLSFLRLNSTGDEFVFSKTVGGSANEQEEIFVVGADGHGVRRVTENAYWDLYPVWSPDGSRIAFLSWRAKSLGVFMMNSDGSDPVEVIDSASQEADIDWVDDLMVFTLESQVWAMRPDGRDVRRVTDPPRSAQWGKANLPFGDYDPRISPDGQKIVFERLVGDESPHGNYDLFVVDLATLEEVRLTATGFSQGLPSWSHSGDQLVYIVSAIDGVGQYDVYVMNADGTGSRNITPSFFPPQFLCHWAVFSEDDAAVYFIGEWWQ